MVTTTAPLASTRTLNPFVSNNYALMRTGLDIDRQLLAKHREACVRSITELAEKIPGKEVKIFYTYRQRTLLTAIVVAETLTQLGIKVTEVKLLQKINDSFMGDEDLNSIIQPELSADEFYLFIISMPAIDAYYKQNMFPSPCSIFSQEFSIEGVEE